METTNRPEPRTVEFDLNADGSVFADGRSFRTLRCFLRAFRGCNVSLVPVCRERRVRP